MIQMRTITAFIRPQQCDQVKLALVQLGIIDITLSDVKGFGRQQGSLQQYRGSDAEIRLHRKLKVEVKVDEEMVAPVVEKITVAARTGQVGDGKIFVSPLQKVVQVRTGEERVELA